MLVVEDEHKLAVALKRGLEREGYAVDTAYDSDDGLDAALTGEYSLVVLDRMLPGATDGVGITKAMRERKIHTPVIMLTAKDTVNDRIDGLDGGADDYMVKPFAFQELVARMRALLRRPDETLSSILSVGDLTLNAATFEVRRAGKLISLSGKEYTLLHHLMRHPNQVLSKNNLMSNVWDFDSDILENTIEVYIGYLRVKIDKAFQDLPPLLHTIRGFGYRLGTD